MDNLRIPAPKFYDGKKQLAAALKKQPATDEGGKLLIAEACKRKHIQEAKAASYMRRTHSSSFLNRSDDNRKMYLADFNDLGPRWVQDAHEINSRLATGWYTSSDGFGGETLIGAVLCFTRHGEGGLDGSSYDQKAKGRVIYMAGTRHSNWDGVTLDLDTTDDPDTAARWADSMAEREAEECCEEDEKYRREQQVEELQGYIEKARAKCLKLLRDMRPLRKGSASFPASVCEQLRESVQDYRESIAGWRKEIGELT